MADETKRPGFAKLEDEAREYAAAKGREKQGETRFASTRTGRQAADRPDNPVKAHERHQKENYANQEKRIRGIADLDRRDQVRAEVAKHYTAWGKALTKAHAQRYENSPRILTQKIAALKVADERLISKRQKDELHREAVSEAVAQSNNRIKELNAAMPRMIDRTIDEAVKLPPYRASLDKKAQRAKDTAEAYKARAAAQPSRDRGGRDFER